MHPTYLTLALSILFLKIAIATNEHRPQCRCLPSNSCWPRANGWNSFNSSLSGKLLVVKPVASVCHDPLFNEASCEEVNASFHLSSWRGDQPGAVDQINFETSSVTNETCYIDTPRASPCGQGSVPVYGVAATAPEDIQKAVDFGRTHNLRLTIKNTGHDFLGRSIARGSLQIWTHNMKSITWLDDFRPEGCNWRERGQPAVTIGAGVQLKQLYSAAASKGRTLVAGLANTVGAAGGYIQGGGHSPLGPWKGMASDNALQFQVVTADGSHITANECQNSDLFWALRGGGGGTFGVVTSATLRTFPDVPMILTSLNFTAPAEDFWDFATGFHEFLPALSDAGTSGYYAIFTDDPAQPSFLWFGFQINHTDIAATDSLFGSFIQAYQSGGSSLQYAAIPFESTASQIDLFLTGDDYLGNNRIMGSRLISRKFLESGTGSDQLTQVFRKLAPNQATTFSGHLVAGGQVAKNGHGENAVDSALSPAWRKAITHIVIVRGWENTTPFEQQQEIARNLTEVEMPLLKTLEPNMGAYINEADLNEDCWQQVFWGENYSRLLKLKRKWDPKDVFVCKPCVGSERWDDEGICRVG